MEEEIGPQNDQVKEVKPSLDVPLENSIPKKRKRWPWAVLAGAVFIGAGVGVLVWQPWRSEEPAITVEPTGNNAGTTEVTNSELPSVEALDVNDELVQSVYNRINVGGALWHNTFWSDLLWHDGSDDTVLGIAYLNTEAGECKVETRQTPMGGKVLANACRGGVAVRQKMREIFGREAPIEDGQRVSFNEFYDQSADEFYTVKAYAGGGIPLEMYNEIYKAVKEADELYIYEYAAVVCMVMVGEDKSDGCKMVIDPQDKPHTAQWYQIANSGDNGQEDLSGEVISGMMMGPFVEVDENGNYIGDDWREEILTMKLSDYAAVVGKFKWTFVDDDSGNYVFERLERVE